MDHTTARPPLAVSVTIVAVPLGWALTASRPGAGAGSPGAGGMTFVAIVINSLAKIPGTGWGLSVPQVPDKI
ncbi:NCS2 family permease, partial [Streptomyces klenkii]